MYATTRYNFVRLKATHKISPLEELVGGDLPPSSSQRLTGMGMTYNLPNSQRLTGMGMTYNLPEVNRYGYNLQSARG
jgi:hypothetical protein